MYGPIIPSVKPNILLPTQKPGPGPNPRRPAAASALYEQQLPAAGLKFPVL